MLNPRPTAPRLGSTAKGQPGNLVPCGDFDDLRFALRRGVSTIPGVDTNLRRFLTGTGGAASGMPRPPRRKPQRAMEASYVRCLGSWRAGCGPLGAEMLPGYSDPGRKAGHEPPRRRLAWSSSWLPEKIGQRALDAKVKSKRGRPRAQTPIKWAKRPLRRRAALLIFPIVRTASTGHGAFRTTFSTMLPRSRCVTEPRPPVPITIRSTFQSVA